MGTRPEQYESTNRADRIRVVLDHGEWCSGLRPGGLDRWPAATGVVVGDRESFTTRLDRTSTS